MTIFDAMVSQEQRGALHKRAAHAILGTAGFIFRRLAQAYRVRREIEYLKRLDDYRLKDLGIARGEIEAAVRGGKR